MNPADPSPQRSTVHALADMKDLITLFLANNEKDVVKIQQALNQQDFTSIQTIGHKMKGAGSGFGFDEITRLGKELEAGAQSKDLQKIAAALQALASYVKTVDVIFDK